MADCVPWQIDDSCCDSWDSLDPSIQERSQELAWGVLRVLSGGMVGHCQATLRPCVTAPCDVCVGIATGLYPDPSWRCSGDGCSCEQLSQVHMPGRVAAIDEVWLDGMLMSPDTYRLDGNRLLRVDGEAWPACQDMRLPETDLGTFAVRYIPGVNPGASGAAAAGALACEFAKACTGVGKCRLPSSVVAVVRQGVTMQLGSDLFPGGLTGIKEVDAWLFSINPNALSIPPRVWSPDIVDGRAVSGNVVG